MLKRIILPVNIAHKRLCWLGQVQNRLQVDDLGGNGRNRLILGRQFTVQIHDAAPFRIDQFLTHGNMIA